MKATWQAPATNTDGTPFVKAQFKGWELDVDAAAAIGVPAAWDTDGAYEFDFGAGMNANYLPGKHPVRMRVVAVDSKGAEVRSAWSLPIDWTIPERVPNAPFIVAVE